jgi:hypothetical protein
LPKVLCLPRICRCGPSLSLTLPPCQIRRTYGGNGGWTRVAVW